MYQRPQKSFEVVSGSSQHHINIVTEYTRQIIPTQSVA